jgi:hypothetical protein
METGGDRCSKKSKMRKERSILDALNKHNRRKEKSDQLKATKIGVLGPWSSRTKCRVMVQELGTLGD